VLWDLLKRHRGAAIAIGVVVVVLVRVGFVVLFGGLGYEYALACGLLLPSVCAVWTANALVSEARARPPIEGVLGGLWRGALLAAVAIAIGLLHGVRAGVCDLWGGLAGFVLGPGLGALVGGVWGAIVGELASPHRCEPNASTRHTRRHILATVLALVGPAGTAAVSVWRFYSSPMIFAFDPFVGYFSGTLYDTVVEPGPALLSYRAGSLGFVAAVLCLASTLRRNAAGWLVLETERSTRSFRARLAFAVVLFGACAVEIACGSHLGHWSTSATIARELGGLRSGARCDAIFPSSLRDDEAALVVKDCDEEIAEVEETLGVRGPSRITAYFFRDAQEKKRLMGAADTYIAKPWRDEVYLQMAPYPHPVLGHEIAHVIAGTFGRGPFRIAGSLGGWFPNPGLIEGVAVATSPDEDELTDLEWAAAMKKRNALPPMHAIFSVGFLGQSAQKSYTLAGAFVRWMITTKGVATVRAWYAGEPIETLMGASWSEIDEAFRKALDAVVLPPAAEAYVASKFERPSVFGRRCPHEVDALRKTADACRDGHQIERARTLYDEALTLDPKEHGALLARAVMELRQGDAERGRSEVRAIVQDDKTPLATRNKAREALADDELLSDHAERAAETYADLAAATPDEDAARTLEVKALAARDADAREAVTTLLIAAPNKRPPDPLLAAVMLGQWEARTQSKLAAYLIGKTEVAHGYYAEAKPRFEAVEGAAELTPRVEREALRERAVCACALGDASAATRVREMTEDPAGVYAGSAGGRRDGVMRLLRRCMLAIDER
jgi:tetratricopeptide (TPR) repeat protein